MTELVKAWDEVLRCLDKVANVTRLADRCEAKDNIIKAIAEYTILLPSRPSPQPDQRTCIKCEGTNHITKYWPAGMSTNSRFTFHCTQMECPEHEHIHITCERCSYKHWEHCADHVEANPFPVGCRVCGSVKPLYSLKLRLCHECHYRHYPDITTSLPQVEEAAARKSGDCELLVSPETCAACGATFKFIASTQSSRLGLCSSCWLERATSASESEDGVGA